MTATQDPSCRRTPDTRESGALDADGGSAVTDRDRLIPVTPQPLRSALLDAFWKWSNFELKAGRSLPEGANQPVLVARQILSAGDLPEKAAIACGQTDIGLLVWELALQLNQGLCPAKYLKKRE